MRLLHIAYGVALALIIFGVYWRPWILWMIGELAVLSAFVLALLVWAGPLRSIIYGW